MVGDRVFVDNDLSTIRVTSLADGKFLVGATVGYSNGFQATLYRYNSDGTLDSTFGTAGKQRINVNNIAYLYLNDLQVTGDGKIVLGVSANQGTPSEPNFDFAAVRLNANGSLDTGFGTNGITAIPISTLSTNAADFARAIQINTAGDILIGGYSNQTAVFNGDRQFALVQLKGDTVQTAFSAQSDTTSITIAPVNDAPVLDLNSAASGINFATSFTEDSAPVAIVSNSLTLTDIDSPTISSATITITNLLDGNAEALSLPSTFSYMAATYSTSTGTLRLIGTATLAQYQEVLRTITYTNTSQNPNPNPRTISFVVNDGAVDSEIATSTITITPVNDAPVIDLNGSAAGTSFTTSFTEDGGAVAIVSNDLTLIDVGSPQVNSVIVRITNIQNIGSEFLTANTAGTNITATYYADFGILELRNFDTVANYQQVLRSVTYNNTSQNPTPGDRTISFGVNDSQANSNSPIAIVSVNPLNDAPVLTGTKASLANGSEDTAYTIAASDLLAGFTDVDGDSLSVSELTANNGSLIDNLNGTYSFAPDANFNGTVNLSYNVIDGNGGSVAATQTIAITAVNDAPVLTGTKASLAGSEDTAYAIAASDLLAGFTDVDGDSLSVSGLTATNGSLIDNLNGTYSFAPNANFNGTVDLAYNVIDGNGGITDATQSIAIAAVNDAPVLMGTKASLDNGIEDTLYVIAASDLLAGFTDVDGDSLSVSELTANNGSLIDNLNGTYSFAPNANFNGTVDLAYNVIDGNGGITAGTQSFVIASVNDAPVLTGTKASLANGSEDTAYAIAASDLLTGFTDVDGDTLSVSSLTATNGSLIDNLNGTYSFAPNANFNGTVDLTYNVIDSNGGIKPATQSIVISAVNDAPVLTGTASILAIGTEDMAYTIAASDLLAGFTDVDGDSLSVSGLTATNGTLTNNGNGTYSFTPDANFNGTVNLNYNVIDGNGGITPATQTLAITAVNDAPVGTISISDSTPTETQTLVASNLFTDADGLINAVYTYQWQQSDIGGGSTFTNIVGATNSTFTPTQAQVNRQLRVVVSYTDDQGTVETLTSVPTIVTGDFYVGTSSVNTFTGTNGQDIISGLGNNDILNGLNGDDTFLYTVGDGRDIVDGGAGSDTLNILGTDNSESLSVVFNGTPVSIIAGGTVTNVESITVDLLGGIDTLFYGSTTADLTVNLNTGEASGFTAIANIENVTGGFGNDIITGNSGNNTLRGEFGNDILDGGLGADSLNGGLGNDTYIVDNINDTLFDSGGTDTVLSSIDWTLAGSTLENLTLTGNSDINGTGNGLQNAIFGNSGNNILNGGSNADSLTGGAGNDTYIVDNLNDVVNELANEGTDTILSGVTRTLEANIENLTLTGNSTINGTGNELNNIITGNSRNNILDGGVGADALIGGLGNDTYIVDNLSDSITEALNQGTDLVKSSVSWTLGENLENLTLTGSANIDGTGNSVNNVITGNDGNNILSGGFGNDSLTGGLGADVLVGGFGNDTLFLGLNDGASDRVVYNLGDDSDVVNQFLRGVGGDLLQFNNIVAIDVRTVGGNTQFRLGDGVTGNGGFANGSLLLTLNGVTGFASSNINDNILAGSIPTTFNFS